jgi:metallophosphoesterase (TIGR00282 family)
MIGDIVGKPGRRAVRTLLPGIKNEFGVDLVVANAENSAGGFGLTPSTSDELLDAGVDVITTGNHVWDQQEIIEYLDSEAPVLRPLNFPPGLPGRGYLIFQDVLVVNIIGRVFMKDYDCPFRAMDSLLKGTRDRPRVTLVDFHGEATSEKGAMGWYLNGRVSAVVGTHTHVGTVDTMVLPGGTAYVTDLGMVGPSQSIIGDDPEPIIERFLTQMNHRMSVAKGPVRFSSALIDIDASTGKATAIQRVDRFVD